LNSLGDAVSLETTRGSEFINSKIPPITKFKHGFTHDFVCTVKSGVSQEYFDLPEINTLLNFIGPPGKHEFELSKGGVNKVGLGDYAILSN